MNNLWWRLAKMFTGHDYARILLKNQALHADSRNDIVVRCKRDAFMQPYVEIGGKDCYESDFINARLIPLTF